MAWYDNTGLLRKFGQEKGAVGNGGEYNVPGQSSVLEFNVTLSALVDDATTVTNDAAVGIVDQHTMIPEGALIEKVEVITTVAATSSGSGVLDLGVVDKDFTSNDDDDAFAVAEPVASFATIGNVVTYTQGSTRHGVLVGDRTTKPLYFTASWDTGAFQTGAVKVRIFYSM